MMLLRSGLEGASFRSFGCVLSSRLGRRQANASNVQGGSAVTRLDRQFGAVSRCSAQVALDIAKTPAMRGSPETAGPGLALPASELVVPVSGHELWATLPWAASSPCNSSQVPRHAMTPHEPPPPDPIQPTASEPQPTRATSAKPDDDYRCKLWPRRQSVRLVKYDFPTEEPQNRPSTVPYR